MKACPLYWYLYFAFHLASQFSHFLVLFVFATGHSCCYSSVPDGFNQPLMSSDRRASWHASSCRLSYLQGRG
ncbi:hypothetical protein BS78_03G076500, partial [Paspalum vaginatum]